MIKVIVKHKILKSPFIPEVVADAEAGIEGSPAIPEVWEEKIEETAGEEEAVEAWLKNRIFIEPVITREPYKSRFALEDEKKVKARGIVEKYKDIKKSDLTTNAKLADAFLDFIEYIKTKEL